MISIKNLHKSFFIPHERHFSLRSRILGAFKESSYTELKVLKDISIEIGEGECVGIIGHNGCGKSTLLKLIAGIIVPDSGEILVKGGISPFLELGVGFNYELSVYDNIYLYGSVMGLSGAEIDEKFDSMIEFAGLENFVDAKLKTLSSGMQVRAAFAVASAVDRSIYLADEVLAVGDVNFQEKCLNIYRDMQDRGKTIIFVSHSLDSIRQFCSRAIWLNNGEISASGPTDSVIQKYLTFMNNGVRQDVVKPSLSRPESSYKAVIVSSGHILLNGSSFNAMVHSHQFDGVKELGLTLFDDDSILSPVSNLEENLVDEYLPETPSSILQIVTDSRSFLRNSDSEKHTVERVLLKNAPSTIEKCLKESTKFDVVILHDLVNSVNSIELFDYCEQLLEDNGHLIIIDQFSCIRTADTEDNLIYQPEFIALSQRFGFELLRNQNVSQNVLNSFIELKKLFAGLGSKLSSDPYLNDGYFPDLSKYVARVTSSLENGTMMYSLLQMQKQSTPKYRVSGVRASDSEKIRELFHTVFNCEMTEELWFWKYGEGRGKAIVVRKDGNIVSHFGGTKRRILLKGQNVISLSEL